VIEGAKLTVCVECSKHGKSTWEEPVKTAVIPQRQTISSQGASIPGPIKIRKKVVITRVDTSQEIVEDYADVIREARKSIGLSHEDLGKKISEKESVLKKVETRKITPNDQLISKLEHALKIKLLVPVAEEKVPLPKTASREFTLGDAIKIGKKGKGE
jgi:putative transcription factor